jgi:hypothetical protein
MDCIHVGQDRRIGKLLWTRFWTFGFHKMLLACWTSEQLLGYQDIFSVMVLVKKSEQLWKGRRLAIERDKEREEWDWAVKVRNKWFQVQFHRPFTLLRVTLF